MKDHLDYRSLSDDGLVIMVQEKDDSVAFDVLFLRYVKYVDYVLDEHFSDAFKLEERKDLRQEVFIKAWNVIKRYAPGDNLFRHWLATLAYRYGIDQLRKKQSAGRNFRSFLRYSNIFDQLLVCRGDLSEPESFIDERLEIVQRALDKLTERQRTAYLLFVFHQMKQYDVASKMGVTTRAVEQAVFEAKKKLHKFIFQAG